MICNDLNIMIVKFTDVTILLTYFQQSEDEALARAIANSVQDKKGDQSNPQSAGSDHLQEDEDTQFARAIAASMEQNPRQANGHQHNSNSCNVC